MGGASHRPGVHVGLSFHPLIQREGVPHAGPQEGGVGSALGEVGAPGLRVPEPHFRHL